MGYDGKYGLITTQYGDIPPDEPVIVFQGRDALVPKLLRLYAGLCEQAGSPQRHIELVEGTGGEMLGWQARNPDQVRKPDSERSRKWLGEAGRVGADGQVR
jgi:hypothetical protein